MAGPRLPEFACRPLVEKLAAFLETKEMKLQSMSRLAGFASLATIFYAAALLHNGTAAFAADGVVEQSIKPENNGNQSIGKTPRQNQREDVGGSNKWFSPCFDGRAFRFRSTFDGPSKVVADGIGEKATLEGGEVNSLCGTATHIPPPNFRMGYAIIQFQGGTAAERDAQVSPAPDNPLNRVLGFRLLQPNVNGTKGFPVKGRVQMVLNGNKGVRQVRSSVRMYLHSGFNAARSYPHVINWLNISEWWNNPGWGRDVRFPFRIGVNLVKESGERDAPLRFKVSAETLNTTLQKFDNTVWSKINTELSVPVEKWISLDYWFVEGGQDKGRFVLGAQVDGHERVVVFDVHDTTHHPDDPAPDGLSQFNPVKLYTSGGLIDYVRSQGKNLEISWDDFELVACPMIGTDTHNSCELIGPTSK